MYDIILCVLATTKNNRLPVFTKIGYKAKNCNYKIVYLVDDEAKPDYVVGDWHVSPDYPLSVRFVDYLKNTKDEFRWLMQVDDDSCTDLDKTIELLDYFYDHKDNVILTSSSTYFLNLPVYINQNICRQNCSCYHLEPSLQNVYKDMQIKYQPADVNDHDVVPYLTSCWEHSVLTKPAVEKIKNYDRLEEFINSCLLHKPKYGDQVPYALAKIAKVPISNCFFFSPLPTIEQYSGINKTGRFAHIHHVCDYWESYEKLIEIVEKEMIFEDSKQIEEYLEKNIDDSYWFFYSLVENKTQSRCAVKLKKDGSIELMDVKWNLNANIYNLSDKNWKLVDNSIVITNKDNQSLLFCKIKNKLYGTKVENTSFFLSKIHATDIMYWKHDRDSGILSRI